MPVEEALVAVVVDRDDLVVEQVEHGDRGRLAASWAAAHWPSSLPALKLSVANVMSTVLAGSGGVSRAITYSPASRAFLIAELTPVLIGVMRMPLSPRAMASSIAVIWPWSSPSCLPEATVSLTLFFVGVGLGALLHGDEERVGRVLGDERDADRRAAAVPPVSEDEPRLHAAMARLRGHGRGDRQPGAMRERLRPPDVVGRDWW